MLTESQEFLKLEEEAKIQVDLEKKNSENMKLEDNVNPRILNADIES